MRDNKKIIGIIALTELKGIGPAFVKKVVSNNSFEAVNTIHEIKEITTANNKQFDDDTIYEAVERAKEIVFKCKEEGITFIAKAIWIYFTIKQSASLEQENRMKML